MTDSLRLPKGVWINGALVAVVAAGGGLTYAMLNTSDSTPTTTGRTIAVQRGTVVSDVSASGNVSLPEEVGLNFGASGTVTEIDVRAGDVVKAGQVLAKIDPTAAQQQMTTAQASLTSAEANLAKLQQGQTPQQAALTAQQLKSASDSLSAAKQSYSDTKASITADETLQNANLTVAQNQLSADETAKAAPSKIDQDNAQIAQIQSALSKDAQSLHQAENSLTQAENSYETTVDQNAVSNAPATPDQIASAQLQVSTAQTNLATAQKDLAGCTITAPQAGTIISIAGNVGTPESGGSNSSSSGSSGGSSSGGGANSASSSSSGGTNARSATYTLSQVGTANFVSAAYPTKTPVTLATPTAQGVSTVPASGGAGGAGVTGSASGFIVMGDMTSLTVKAEVAETDAAKLKAGEATTISLNAVPGSSFTGTVLSIDPTSTVVSNVVEYGVTLQFDPGQQGMDQVKSGQTASVAITTDSVDNVLFVPSSAVVTAGGQTTVTVVANGVQTVTPVQVGVVGDTSTEITSGLTEGQMVLLSPRSATSSTGGTRGFGSGGFGTGGGFGGAGGFGTGGGTGGARVGG